MWKRSERGFACEIKKKEKNTGTVHLSATELRCIFVNKSNDIWLKLKTQFIPFILHSLTWLIRTVSKQLTRTKMFRKNISYRDCPITIKTLRDGVHLNVRKGFDALDTRTMAGKDKLKNYKLINGDDAKTITLEDMTAAEYADDLRAYHGTHLNKLRDILYIDTFRAAILDNAHLFKDKVNFTHLCTTKKTNKFYNSSRLFIPYLLLRLWLTFGAVWVFCQCSVHWLERNMFMPSNIQI